MNKIHKNLFLSMFIGMLLGVGLGYGLFSGTVDTVEEAEFKNSASKDSFMNFGNSNKVESSFTKAVSVRSHQDVRSVDENFSFPGKALVNSADEMESANDDVDEYCQGLSSVGPGVNPTDCYAMVSILNGFTNGHYQLNNWGNFNLPISEWEGVEVVGNNVFRLNLREQNLTGEVSPEIGNFMNLTDLDFSHNYITGDLPGEIWNLDKLRVLAFGFNENLSWVIPSEISNLNLLKRLEVQKTDLTGTIPSELTSLSDLETLVLSFGNLTGYLPTDIGNLSKLRNIWISSNQLQGPIPASFWDLSDLETVNLGNNNLVSILSPLIENLSNIREFQVHNNNLSGVIPDTIENLSNLEVLGLSRNNFVNYIPESISNLNLDSFYVYENCLLNAEEGSENPWNSSNVIEYNGSGQRNVSDCINPPIEIDLDSQNQSEQIID